VWKVSTVNMFVLLMLLQVKVLYVKNLKSLVTEDELRQVFEPYGQVGRVKKTKDYGFIHFENREDALRAMEELNGTVSCLTAYLSRTLYDDFFQLQELQLII